MTMTEYLEDWLLLRSGGLRARTVDSYRSLLRLHILPEIGNLDVNRLSSLDLRSLLAGIVASGHTRTAELCFVLLKCALADHPAHPMQGVPRPAHIQKSPEPWTDDQISTYLVACMVHRHGLALSLGLVLGLRRGEICGARWEDIDFDSAIINITNQRLRLDSGEIVDALPKSRTSVRPVPIPRQLLLQLKGGRQLTGYICGLTPSGLDAAHRALVRALGLPYIPLHGLRHSMATACIRHGGDMRCLQLILGHASYATTANRYTHPDGAMLRNAVDAAAARCYTVAM